MRIRTLLVALLAGLLVAGCGDSSSSAGSDGSGADAGALDHVDGTVSVQDQALLVKPVDGGAPRTFELGPAVEVAEVRAIEASGAPARVTFRPGDEPPVAAAVAPAPRLGEGLQTYEGTVVSVDEDELVVDGSDGERSFDVSAAADGVFDVAHLEDHADEGEPIKVYFDPDAPDAGIAYEDA